MIDLLRDWPRSLPDYRWPDEVLAARYMVKRALFVAVFHICYSVGLVLSMLIRSRPAAAIIRTDGIGDALLFEPALELLARSLSPQEIHLWAPSATRELMRACPVIRRRIVIPRGFRQGNLLVFRSVFWRARLGLLLGRRRYEVAIYPAQSPEPLGNWLFCSIRARIRWLNYGDTINQYEEQRAATHARADRILDSRPGNAHELMRNAYLSTQWGGSLELRKPKLYFTARAIAQAEQQIADWREVEQQVRASAIVVVIPTGSQPINRYPADKWRAVLEMLWSEHRAICALIGGRRDESFIATIARSLGEVPCLRLRKPLGVLATAALIGRADAMISVDTGLAHAALAQDVPSIILRIGGDPGRFFPWPGRSRSMVLYQSMPCEGCHNRCHLSEAKCITDVSPKQIVEAYRKLSVTRAAVEYSAPAARWLKVAG